MSPSPNDFAERLEAFVRERFMVATDDEGFDRHVNLWEEGYVDSLGSVELIEFVESSLSVTLPTSVLFDPQFTSIAGIAKLAVALMDSRD